MVRDPPRPARSAVPRLCWGPLVLGLGLSLAGGCGGEPAEDRRAAVLEQAQRSVVLLVADEGEGKRAYGAGVVIDPQGLVLTSLHVVAGDGRLRAMLYDPARISYAPTDGGLSRYLFENEEALVDARLLRADPTLDLAVVDLDVDGPLPTLTTREGEARPGDSVWALGHPQENVWSFTSGVVSALHQGMIQHDAAINEGNSGGPLIDGEGRLLGVNTMKLFGGAEGMGYARPAGLGLALVDEAARPVVVDRHTPEQAFLTCERAIELSVSLAKGCLDWLSAAPMGDRALDRAQELLELDAPRRARLQRYWQDEGRGAWVADFGAKVRAHLSGTDTVTEAPRYHPPDLWATVAERERWVSQRGTEARLRTLLAEVRERADAREEEMQRQTGLKTNLSKEGRVYQLTRRMGMRVEQTVIVPDRAIAWVQVAGRNLDGSPYRYTECWKDRDGLWTQPFLCALDHLDTFPEGWPPMVIDEPNVVELSAIKMALGLIGRELS